MSVENSFENNDNLTSGDNLTPEEVAESGHNSIMKQHKLSKEYATELQNSVAEIQEAKLGVTLRRLMERTGDNTELVNSLNGFLDSLDHQSNFGNSGETLGKSRANDLAKFLKEATKAVRWTVGHGNSPTDIKINFTEWES